MHNEAPEKRNKRKRKKTFLQNARKYAKKGCFGRGSHMDPDTYQYFVRILEVFNQGFDNEEDKAAFVANVFEQTEQKEVECSCNQVGCRVIETLLPFANNDVLRRFMEKFSEDLRPLSKDRFASFVLQALVATACQKQSEFGYFAIKVSKFLLNNLEDYVWDNFGNRVIRTCLCGLMQIPEEKRANATPVCITNEQVPEEHAEIVKEYGRRLIIWPQFSELCSTELTSGLLQVLLKALKKADSKLFKNYLEKLLNENFLKGDSDDKEKLPQAFLSTGLLMLLETSIQLAGKKMFKVYCDQLFSGRMLKLALLRSTNHSVQKVLAQCVHKEQFESFFDELGDHLGEIIEKGHSGVALALCQGCKRLSSKQGPLVQNMMKTLGCYEPEERQLHFVISMCRLVPYDPSRPLDNSNLLKEKLSLQGTLMLQLMLEFNKPIKVINSILSMDPGDLKNLFSNPMGSHIVDSYVKSIHVGEKSREKLVRKMRGTYQDLATSKYGSRSFEAIWNVCNTKAKVQIMEELAHKDGAWSNSEFGKIIAGKVNLVLFKRNREDWKSGLGKVAKPEEVLAEVLK